MTTPNGPTAGDGGRRPMRRGRPQIGAESGPSPVVKGSIPPEVNRLLEELKDETGFNTATLVRDGILLLLIREGKIPGDEQFWERWDGRYRLAREFTAGIVAKQRRREAFERYEIAERALAAELAEESAE